MTFSLRPKNMYDNLMDLKLLLVTVHDPILSNSQQDLWIILRKQVMEKDIAVFQMYFIWRFWDHKPSAIFKRHLYGR